MNKRGRGSNDTKNRGFHTSAHTGSIPRKNEPGSTLTQHAACTDGADHQGTGSQRPHLRTPVRLVAVSVRCGPGTCDIGSCDGYMVTMGEWPEDVHNTCRGTRSREMLFSARDGHSGRVRISYLREWPSFAFLWVIYLDHLEGRASDRRRSEGHSLASECHSRPKGRSWPARTILVSLWEYMVVPHKYVTTPVTTSEIRSS
jgi:hypothetical protein